MNQENIVDDFEKINSELPEFVEYVKKEEGKNSKWLIIRIFLVLVTWAIILIFFKSYIIYLGLMFSMIGATLLARGSIRPFKSIVCLSVPRFDYHKALADELLTSNRNTSLGLFLIVISILIETVYITISNLNIY